MFRSALAACLLLMPLASSAAEPGDPVSRRRPEELFFREVMKESPNIGTMREVFNSMNAAGVTENQRATFFRIYLERVVADGDVGTINEFKNPPFSDMLRLAMRDGAVRTCETGLLFKLRVLGVETLDANSCTGAYSLSQIQQHYMGLADRQREGQPGRASARRTLDGMKSVIADLERTVSSLAGRDGSAGGGENRCQADAEGRARQLPKDTRAGLAPRLRQLRDALLDSGSIAREPSRQTDDERKLLRLLSDNSAQQRASVEDLQEAVQSAKASLDTAEYIHSDADKVKNRCERAMRIMQAKPEELRAAVAEGGDANRFLMPEEVTQTREFLTSGGGGGGGRRTRATDRSGT